MCARRSKIPLLRPLAGLAFALAALAFAARPAWCDRVILTPTGTALMQKQSSGELMQTFSEGDQTALWANTGLDRLEIEGAYFHSPDHNAVSLSAETPLLPETFATPAVAVGIRDILNTTHDVRGLGYGGRAYYLAVTKSYPATQPRAFFRDISVSGGLGGGSLHGPFGSITAQMPLGLLGEFEYDGTRANTRLALPISRTSRLEYTRIGHEGFVGFQLNSPVSF
ncbi:MAG TPA: hypothetical protein VFW40_00285 [Capsulimonadaceae bacterium]|nr:hypothetical protein [Capsulimonadaceae bacterium]